MKSNIYSLRNSGVKYVGKKMPRLFQNFSVSLGNTCRSLSRNLCILSQQWLRHTAAFCKGLWFIPVLEIHLDSRQLPRLFAEANSAFIVITSEIFPSKIYIRFTIFNTYFSTKLSFTNKRYHLHVLEKCLYVLQEVKSIIYFWQYIHPLSLMFFNSFFHLIFFRSRTRRNRVSGWCSNVLISMTLFGKKKENAKVLTHALDNILIFFVILSLC